MRTITSRDGTRIAFWQSGSGPALLLIHGTTADHTTTWRRVIDDFAQRFTVYAMDRRGRGGSGDSPDYDLQREAEDVCAVVDAIGGPVNVLGHSFGAFCAIEAALLTPNMRRLILYEGVPLRGAELCEPAVVEQLERLLASGDLDATLAAMFRDVVRMAPEEIELLRSQRDAWAVRLGNTPTMPREIAAVRRYTFDPARFANMRTPTLFLVGGASHANELDDANGVARALPDARVVILPEQQHIAMHTAPELFVREVVRFLS